MEHKKLVRNRRSYYDDYKKTASGEYIYAGPEYEFESSNGKSRKRWMLEMILLNVAALACVLVPGFMFVPGLSYCAYVVLPYAASVLLFGYMLLISMRLAAAKDSVKAWEYDKSAKVLPVATVAAVVIAAANFVCEIVFLAINGSSGQVTGAVVYMVCQAAAGAISFFAVKLARSAKWNKKPGAEI